MIKIAVCIVLACLLVTQLRELPSLALGWFILIGAILFTFRQSRLLALFLIAVCYVFVVAGQTLNQQLSADLIGQDIHISGEIGSIPKIQGRRAQFIFFPDQPANITLPKKLLLNWYQPFPDDLKSRQRWQFTVRLKPPHGLANPGGFDYEAWLFQLGIGATGYIRPKETQIKLAETPVWHIDKLRHHILTHLEEQFDAQTNLGILQALTTGIRHNISPEQWQLLQRTGTSHLIAISGLHIGFIAALGFFVFRFFWLLRADNLLIMPANSFGAISGLVLATIYAFLAGLSIPTQRALIMVAAVTISLVVKRPSRISEVLACAIMLILVLDPLSVLSAGFWLSCLAVAIILYVSQQRFPQPKWQWLKIHTLIALGLTPLLILFFMQTSLIAPIANLLAVPFVSFFIVPLALLGSLFSFIHPAWSTQLFNIADSLLHAFWSYTQFLGDIPHSYINITSPPYWYWPILFIAIVLILSPKRMPAKWLALPLLFPLFFLTPNRPEQNEFWFSLLDVGQGLAAVVETKHHTLLFDTGAGFNQSFNSGKTVIEPFLRQRGIHQLDRLIVSHSDNDHIGGASYLLDHFKITSVLTSESKKLTNSELCIAGQSWQWDGVHFMVLNPKKQDKGSKNDLSCVLKVSNQFGSVLLTADIERQAEEDLVKRYGNELQSTVLVAPHHGSRTSSTWPFIKKVNPEYVLFPTGYLNRFHFPNKQVLKRYHSLNSTVFNTATDGAILLRMNRHFPGTIQTWRHDNKKIWTHLATE